MAEQGAKRFKRILVIIAAGVGLLTAAAFLCSSEFASPLRKALSPFFIAAVICMLLLSPARLCEARLRRILRTKGRLPSALSLIIVYALFLFTLFVIVLAVLPMLCTSLYSLALQLPELSSMAQSALEDAGLTLRLPDSSELAALLMQYASLAASHAAALADGVLSFLTGLLLSVYLLADAHGLYRRLKALVFAFLPKYAPDLLGALREGADIFSRYLCGMLADCAAVGALYFVSMTLLGLPYSAQISALCALLTLFPYAGPLVGGAAGFLMILTQSTPQALVFLGIFALVQLVEGQLIFPHVVGKALRLPALFTLCAAVLGGRLFGAAGAVLFVPLTSFIYSRLRRGVNLRKKTAD